MHGVDLYPPPQQWVPPNVVLEVDDIAKKWSWNKQFDLAHMRILMGSFDEAGWTSFYQQAYDNLAPGCWIEHLEYDIGTFPSSVVIPSSLLASSHNNTNTTQVSSATTIPCQRIPYSPRKNTAPSSSAAPLALAVHSTPSTTSGAASPPQASRMSRSKTTRCLSEHGQSTLSTKTLGG